MSSQSQGSRLAQIQMRYQQKQLQENSQKKNEMFDETQKLLTSSLGAGKVRAMFDERRQSQRKTAGIDKSYLLEPIVVDTNKLAASTKRSLGPAKPSRTIDQHRVNYSKVIVPPLQNRLINHDINGNNHFSSSGDPLDRTFRDASRIIASNNNAGKALSHNNSEKINSTTTTSVMRKAPTVQANAKSSSSSVDESPLKNVTNQNNRKASPAKSSTSNSSSARSGKSFSSSQSRTQSTVINNNVAKKSSPIEKSPPSSFDDDAEEDENDNAAVPEGLVRCSICKRNFAEDRIEKHTVICQKTKAKKRKVFDASKKRVEGTEAAVFVAKKPTSGSRVKAQQKQPAGAAAGATTKSSWRTKHEEFIAAVRAAREVQAHLAKGGKLSDLPPPPPSENPDYVQCPHCSRRFNEAAAARHIPQCKNMKHNKPKAASKTTVGAGGKAVSQMKRR